MFWKWRSAENVKTNPNLFQILCQRCPLISGHRSSSPQFWHWKQFFISWLKVSALSPASCAFQQSPGLLLLYPKPLLLSAWQLHLQYLHCIFFACYSNKNLVGCTSIQPQNNPPQKRQLVMSFAALKTWIVNNYIVKFTIGIKISSNIQQIHCPSSYRCSNTPWTYMLFEHIAGKRFNFMKRLELKICQYVCQWHDVMWV